MYNLFLLRLCNADKSIYKLSKLGARWNNLNSRLQRALRTYLSPGRRVLYFIDSMIRDTYTYAKAVDEKEPWHVPDG